MMHSDIPIKNTTEDLLGRSQFAKSLATAIIQKKDSDSLCIGLYGPWGSGKTSLLNMVFESIQLMDKEVAIINFNPWMCSDSRTLVSQFFQQLSAELRLKKIDLWKRIDDYSASLSLVKLIPTVGPLLEFGKGPFEKIIKKQVGKGESLQYKKDKIVEQLRKKGTSIVVSIDDIDRLPDDEIRLVFQLVKSLADFPNTTYVLAFDYDVVTNALEKTQTGHGKDYLEKIIQLPFDIPSADMSVVYGLLTSRLSDIIPRDIKKNWEDRAWANLFEYGIRGYITTIRNVNRFINLFSLKYSLLEGSIYIPDWSNEYLSARF